MKYIMRKIPFVNGKDVSIPVGSLDVKIVWDAEYDGWVVLFLELPL